jgi:putative DNA primase/helicase
VSAVVTMPAKPTMVVPESGAALPECLTERPQWVCWTFECRGGKYTKCPRTPTGAFAKSDTPSTWSTFAEVTAAATRREDMGIGFVFATDDPFIGIDLDDCLTPDGALKPWAAPIMERFADSYAEISPSGHGIKIWAEASLAGLIAGTGTRLPCGDGQVEIYERSRFFTVTGRRYATSPLGVAEHQGDTEWLLAHIGAPVAACGVTGAIPASVPEEPMPAPEPAREFTGDEQAALRAKLEAARANVPKFDDLWLGGACGYYAAGKPDPSRADLAF